MREPLIVRGNDIPRSIFRCRLADHLLVGFLILIPTLAFPNVARGELPVFFGFLQPRQKTLLLFLSRNMEEELANHRSIASHVPLKTTNILKAFFPDVFRYQRWWQLLVV